MKPIFYLLILFLPTQLGRHFWPNFSFIQGLRVDYLSPTIYLTDLLLVLLVLTWLGSKLSTLNSSREAGSSSAGQLSTLFRRYWLLIVLAPIIIGVGIYFSQYPLAGLYGLIRLLLFILFGTYVVKTITTQRQIEGITLFLMVGIFFESSLAIWQFVKQASIGGVFWFFGERTFTSETPGIARAIIDGQSILRPYGTFSHPNVLAGFLIVVMTLGISKIKYQKSNIKGILFTLTTLIGSLALVLTMSRTAIVLWMIILSVWFLIKLNKKPLRHFILLTLIVLATAVFLWPRLTALSLNDEAIARRQELAVAAVGMLKEKPLIGVGLNNFLVDLPEFQKTQSVILYLQPVHNIYLLILAETGIVGFVIFMWFIVKTFKRLLGKNKFSILNSQFSICLLAILILGLFDHYWLTLQQGQLLFALILGLSWAKIKG